MHTCAGNGDPDAALPSALITPANALVDQPAGITVGLLDTGVDAGDSALTGRLDQENARSFAADGDTAHGTNAARILALANGVTILPLTVVDGNTGTCQLSAVIQAIGYAMEKGVGLLNCSFCFDEYNTPLKDLMEDSGILFVAAVGNGAVVAGGTKKSKSYSVYDELGQEIRVETDLALDADGNPVRSVTEYTYDGLGRRIRQRTLADGDGGSAVWAVTEYGYDALGRLIWVDEQESADVHHVTRYAYDAAGRKIAQREGLSAQPLDNSPESLYSEAEGGRLTVYTYDEDGNLLTKTVGSGDDRVCVAAYTYDSLNRLSGAVSASVREMPDLMDAGGVTLQQVKTRTVAFRYDANAQRIGKTVTLGYAADGEDAALTAEVRHVVNDTAAAYDLITQDGATRESSYLFGTKGADGAAQFEALYTGDTLYAAVSDAHTDVVGLRTVSGTTVEYAYDAFGNELSAAETAVYNPYRYVGQYYDSETGLYYLRARYYDPETGRFTQRDSYQGEVNNPQSLNLCAYATNNPVRFLDRFGHMNYLTQTGTLFRGILSGVVSEIAGLFNIQGYIDMAKAIFSGELKLKTLFAGLADNHYVYVLMHLWVLNPFKSASNNDVTEMGKHIGGIVYDIASVLIGAAAAKVLSVLKTTKIGSKIASTLSKAKIKVASTAKNVAARAKAAAKDIRSAFKRGALKKVGHHLFPK